MRQENSIYYVGALVGYFVQNAIKPLFALVTNRNLPNEWSRHTRQTAHGKIASSWTRHILTSTFITNKKASPIYPAVKIIHTNNKQLFAYLTIAHVGLVASSLQLHPRRPTSGAKFGNDAGRLCLEIHSWHCYHAPRWTYSICWSPPTILSPLYISNRTGHKTLLVNVIYPPIIWAVHDGCIEVCWFELYIFCSKVDCGTNITVS